MTQSYSQFLDECSVRLKLIEHVLSSLEHDSEILEEGLLASLVASKRAVGEFVKPVREAIFGSDLLPGKTYQDLAAIKGLGPDAGMYAGVTEGPYKQGLILDLIDKIKDALIAAKNSANQFDFGILKRIGVSLFEKGTPAYNLFVNNSGALGIGTTIAILVAILAILVKYRKKRR